MWCSGVPDPEDYGHTFSGDGAVIGQEALLDVTFHSNPEPLSFLWHIPDISEPINDSNGTYGRYHAENLTQV